MSKKSFFSNGWIRDKIKSRILGGAVGRLKQSHKFSDVNMSLHRLKKNGVYPNLIFDIGSYNGEFIDSCKNIWPESKVVGFEALEEKANFLRKKFKNKKDVTIVEALIGNEDKTNMLFYADANASSVLYSEEVNTKKQKRSKPMIKLDTYISGRATSPPDFLQLDTLSFEFEILEGIKENMPFIDTILLQVNFLEVFHGVKLANKVISYLAEFDFVIYDVCDIHRRPLDNALWQMDLIFIKKNSPLRSKKNWA